MSTPPPPPSGDTQDGLPTIAERVPVDPAATVAADLNAAAELMTQVANLNQTPVPIDTQDLRPTQLAETMAAPALTGGFSATAATRLSAPGDITPVGGSTFGEAQTLAVPSPSTGGLAGDTGNSQLLSRSGSFTRQGRTRLNLNLPADAQQLDLKLQSSRTSVLADMATTRFQTNSALPPNIIKLIEQQGTEGRYSIDRPLAAGGMGAVLSIDDHDFRRSAAMKIIKAQYSTNPEALERFLAEAQVTAQLEHPNIVPIHDLGVMDDGTMYFTMKLIEGASLGTVVKQLRSEDASDPASVAAKAHWTEEEKLLTFLKVLDGVGFAHARGVVHRDIKPDNIMLGAHGEVLVVDWGIAKVLAGADLNSDIAQRVSDIRKRVESIRGADSLSATMDGSAMGTVFYMPPEQCRGDLAAIDGRSDIYALGATLYELLALRRSVEGESGPIIMSKVVRGDFTPLDHVCPNLNPDLVAIIHRSMALTPERRYPTCAAFADDLRRYLAGQAVQARTRGIVELIRAWIAQHRRQLLIGGGATALVIVVASGTLWYAGTQKRAQAQGLVETAGQRYAVLGPNASVDDLAEMKTALGTALNLDGGNAEAKQLTSVVGDALVRAKLKREADAERLAKKKSAQAQFDDATHLREQGKFEEALALLTLAVAFDPENTAILDAREQVKRTVDDASKRQRTQAAAAQVAGAKTLLDRAETTDATSAEFAQALDAAKEALVRAQQDPQIPAIGAQAQADRVKDLKLKRDAALSAQADRTRAEQLTQQAQTALSANQLDDAYRAITQAIGFFGKPAAGADDPVRDSALTMQRQVLTAIDTRDRAVAQAQRRTTAETKAAELLKSAHADAEQIRGLETQQQRLSSDIAALRATVVDTGAKARQPLFAKQAELDTVARELTERWAGAEGLAAQAAVAVVEFAGAPGAEAAAGRAKDLYADAKRLQADLYFSRLSAARRSGQLNEVQAYTNLLARADEAGRYAAVLANRATVTVSANVSAQPLVVGSDGRLVPDATVKPLTLTAGTPTTLAPAGAWQLSAGAVTLAVVIESAPTPLTIPWPTKLPSVPGHPLKYVPASDAGPAFLLGESEVTLAQYLEFINDPTVFAEIRAKYADLVRAEAIVAQQGPEAVDLNSITYPFVPRGQDRRTPAALIDFSTKESAPEVIKAIVIGADAKADQPVSGISRDDAAAYCAWLAKRSGPRVRLPRRAEWQFAANGNDPQRVYPWGPRFDDAFSVNAALQQPQPVRSLATDVGPFGHADLAGNVREWLGDVNTKAAPRAAGVFGALIAGGAFNDDGERYARADQIDSVTKDVTNPAIGFRILVELQ